MPAKGSYYHIYNKGVEGRVIFNDQEDYLTFVGYLREYLSPAPKKEDTKKVFTVNGRTYKGTPHQPKNYFGKVELIAYSLVSDHFHLILNQMAKDSQSNLLRSLCTRYSMYFNKKYKRTGSLFDGPYKSAEVDESTELLPLSRHIHDQNLQSKISTHEFSSYPEYVGKRKSSWVKTQFILSKISDYEGYIGKHVAHQGDTETLKHVILEQPALERITPSSHKEKSFKAVTPTPLTQTRNRTLEFLFATTSIFILLFAVGMKNVLAAKASLSLAEEKPRASIVINSTPSIDTTITPSVAGSTSTMTVKIKEGYRNINVRQEPSTDSQVIDKANEGNTFDLVSEKSGWLEIQLTGGTTGYISTQFADIEETKR